MPRIATITFLMFLLVASAVGQPDFSYYVHDEIRSPISHFDYIENVVIDRRTGRPPLFRYTSRYRVHGLNQETLEIKSEKFEGYLSDQVFEALLAKTDELSRAGLNKRPESSINERSIGWIHDRIGRTHIFARPDTAVRIL